jgi:hypothetical protein
MHHAPCDRPTALRITFASGRVQHTRAFAQIAEWVGYQE